METLLPFVIIYYNTAISLGVGGSSIVIASFITSLMDKDISTDERRLLGVIYITLRIAMASIAIMLAFISFQAPQLLPSLVYVWLLVGVLYINAILMTKHWISAKYGPALQAATWYTLGFVVVIDAFSLYTVTPVFFAALYLVDIVVALIAVNFCLWYFLSHRK